MGLSRVLLRLLAQALLLFGFVLALSGIIRLGNQAGPIEAILMFVGATGLVFLSWMAWDNAASLGHRGPHA